MARPKAKEPEKDPWSWVATCNPLEVKDEHVKSVYRINVPRCSSKPHKRNCKANPYCVLRLGEERWSDAKILAGDQFNDPDKERRKENTYVGLKNLGATCYVNSLLQLWFHNLNFRSAIFKWDPLQDPVPEEQQSLAVTEEKEILKQLQIVFGLMQYGRKRYVDPTDFICSLRLDTSVQQDAQEFSKLFLSKLESVLSYQSQKEVRDLIKDNFCGEYAYVTKCMRCKRESRRPSKFYELDLNIIKGHKTIQDCLKDFMKEEILEGDNKYFCTTCSDKEDAQRFISLTELPPVLNLQLMRFFYDKNTGHKKKLNTAIQFPERLNMTEFVANATGDLEYTLSAVLVHGGRSANSGHYIALICDSETGTWYKFNDESVEKIDAKKLKFAIEDECDETSSSKKNKVQKAPPKGSYHSINAYMLVYTRVNPQEAASNGEVPCRSVEWQLPPHLEDFVAQQNDQFENWVLEIRQINDVTVGRNLSQQDEMISMFTMLLVDSDNEDFDAVPTSCLTKWLSNPDMDISIDNLKRTCEHGKLRPSDVVEMKYINSEIAERLYDRYDANHRFRAYEFQCRDCVAAHCFKLRFKSKINEENAYIAKRVKNLSNETQNMYWVGKHSFQNWRKLARENLEHGLYNANKLSYLQDVHIPKTPVDNDCDAGKENKENNENVDTTEQCRLVLQNGGIGDHHSVPTNGISEKNHANNDCQSGDNSSNTQINCLTPTIRVTPVNNNGFQCQYFNFLKNSRSEPTANDVVPENGNGIDEENELSRPVTQLENPKNPTETSVELKKENNCSSVPSADSEVPITNHTNEPMIVDQNEATYPYSYDIKRRFEDDDTNPNAGKKFNEDVLCSHGNLCIEESSKRRLVPEDVWRIFKKYFPTVKEFKSDVEPCNLCKSIYTEDEVTKGRYRSRALSEKENLIELYHERSRPSLPNDIEYDCMFYILNKEFYRTWRQFVKEAGKKEPPVILENSLSLLCPLHSKLLYDLNLEMPENIMIVTPSEWEYLAERYSYDYEIKVHCRGCDGFMTTEPGVCDECMRDRMETEELERRRYTNAKIYVQVVKEEIVDDSSSVDECRPIKRAKLSNGNANGKTSAANKTATTNGENAVYANANGNGDAPDVNPIGNSTCCAAQEPTIIATCNLGDVSDPLMNGNDSNNNDSNGNTMCQNLNNVMVNGNGVNNNNRVSSEITAVRRSARSRRGEKKIEISASSTMVLLDIKKKILEMMEVMPSDQHLFTSDGRELTDNSATLADMAIYPSTTLSLRVDKPCIGNDSDEFSICREREQGFVGTILTSGPCIERPLCPAE